MYSNAKGCNRLQETEIEWAEKHFTGTYVFTLGQEIYSNNILANPISFISTQKWALHIIE